MRKITLSIVIPTIVLLLSIWTVIVFGEAAGVRNAEKIIIRSVLSEAAELISREDPYESVLGQYVCVGNSKTEYLYLFGDGKCSTTIREDHDATWDIDEDRFILMFEDGEEITADYERGTISMPGHGKFLQIGDQTSIG